MNSEQSFGLSKQHMVSFISSDAWIADNFLVHKSIIEPLQLLCEAANKQGFKLALVSGFRSYQRQATIWDSKINGQTEILDDNGQAIKQFASTHDQYEKIARWSAIPGTSRHHWGTDIDIFSAAAIDQGYSVKLTQQEFSSDGPCGKLDAWLTENLLSYSFFRPYQIDTGGIAPEPWHISHQSLATNFKQQITTVMLKQVWRNHPWCGSNWATKNVEQLYQRYFK